MIDSILGPNLVEIFNIIIMHLHAYSLKKKPREVQKCHTSSKKITKLLDWSKLITTTYKFNNLILIYILSI